MPKTKPRLTDSRVANLGATAIGAALNEYQHEFRVITRRAKERFEQMDWHGNQADAAERLTLYKRVIDRIVNEIRHLLDDRIADKIVWASMKAVYSGAISQRNDRELAETFFNSVTRRIFTTVGVDPQVEFVDTDFEMPPTQSGAPIYHIYRGDAGTITLIKEILFDCRFSTPFQNLQQDSQQVASLVEAHLREIGALRIVERTEMIKSVFYRGKGAYLVGKMFSGSHIFPIVLALHNRPTGIYVDAVLLNENDVSVLFSFTRSYFHVESDRQYDLLRFLKSMMPRKRIAELYISMGHNKHGKTELYRDILHHLSQSDDKFEIAPGKRGMVMLVFTIPGYDVVFKIIRDQFLYPKKGTRQMVMDKYRMVFNHDRAGRLVDAQEFEYLKFELKRFSSDLLEELIAAAPKTVFVDADDVIIKHCYIERRLIPLDIYAREAEIDAAKAAVLDYGSAIKDLAATNIFTGDMLLKNFGVTRHGRVVFYDYDELCFLTDCNFRKPPRAPSFDEEMSAEPWFVIAENDIFPGEFRRFLGLSGELLRAFSQHHEDIFAVDFWRQLQQRITAGEVMHIYPYGLEKRLSDEKME